MQDKSRLALLIRIIATIAILVFCVLWASSASGTVFGVYAPYPECGDSKHPYPVGDVNRDCVVNFVDLALVLDHWLEDSRPR